ncbi:MAG: DUF642 domain-containing protein [Beijerinckiaceae bacterium]|jgi:hypothetical protein
MQPKLLGLLVGAAIGSAFVANPAAAANLIVDGSFEDPTVPSGSYTLFSTGETFGTGNPWSVVGPSGGDVGIVYTNFVQNGISFPAEGGNQWIDLTGVTNSPAEGVQQTVATNSGQQYTLSFYVGNVYNVGGIFGTTSTVDVDLNGTQVLAAENSCTSCTSTLTWELFTYTFTATSASTTIAFLNGDPSNDTSNGLDNISLTATSTTPLPAALPLFASGLGAMGLFGWRRKRKDAAAIAAA